MVKIFNNSNHPVPHYATYGSAGVDLYANIGQPIILKPGEVEMIPTGVFLQLPENIEAQIRPRSSMGRDGVIIPNSPGTIDSDYRGEVKVLLMSISKDKIIMPGQKIAQVVFSKFEKVVFEEVDSQYDLTSTSRGEGGFGSTGKFSHGAKEDMVKRMLKEGKKMRRPWQNGYLFSYDGVMASMVTEDGKTLTAFKPISDLVISEQDEWEEAAAFRMQII